MTDSIPEIPEIPLDLDLNSADCSMVKAAIETLKAIAPNIKFVIDPKRDVQGKPPHFSIKDASDGYLNVEAAFATVANYAGASPDILEYWGPPGPDGTLNIGCASSDALDMEKIATFIASYGVNFPGSSQFVRAKGA